MPQTVSADSAAPPVAVWVLLARPDRWREWSPHVRGAWGLGEPEVEAGRLGAVRLLGFAPVPARILRVDPPTDPRPAPRTRPRAEVTDAGGAWSWRVGAIVMDHRVAPLPGGGSRVSMVLRAPLPLRPLAAAYAPVCELLLRRLARAAERGRWPSPAA